MKRTLVAIATAISLGLASAAFVPAGQDEITVDLFAGGGGASEGIKQATGRDPDIAVNHDWEAVALHMANHPDTLHFVEDVFKVDPVRVCNGRPVGLLWASPDCKHFSKAKGGAPVSKRVRGLAWVVVEWAKAVAPRVIILENVEEFQTWGPLQNDGQPCKVRAGSTFRLWCKRLQNLGYTIELQEIRASTLGTPTIRNRLYVIARRDGEPIVWPDATHGDPESLPVRSGKLLPWRTAGDCIDWSRQCPSIFLTKAEGKALGVKRPLVDATCRRIAKGLVRYVIEAANPFIVPVTHPGASGGGLVVPFITQHANSSSPRSNAADEPLRTQVSQIKGGHFALVSAFLLKYHAGSVGVGADGPFPTVTAGSFHKRPGGNPPMALVTSNMVKLRGTNVGEATGAPVHTISAHGTHHGEVRAFLVKYYGNERDGVSLAEPTHTGTTKDRFAIVTVHGEAYAIADIGLRMFTARELYRAQGFPESYVIDKVPDIRKMLVDIGRGLSIRNRPDEWTWVKLTKTAQVRMCGNSVCPPVARALVAANYTARRALLEAA